MRKIFFALVLCCGFANFSFGQFTKARLDSLKQQLSNAPADDSQGELSYQLARGYRFSNVDSSLFFSDRTLDIAGKLNLQSLRVKALSLKGATLLEIGRLPESLQSQFEALSLSEKGNDIHTRALILNRIGNTYMELGDYRRANEYYFDSKDLFELVGDSGLYYNEISNIGNIYELLQMPDSALYYQELAYEAGVRNKGRDFLTWPEMIFRLGNVYKLKGDKEKALQFYKRGIIESNIDNDLRNRTMNNLFLAKLYHELNVPDSSMKYAYNAVVAGNAVFFKKGVYDASLLLSDLFRNRNEYDSAYKYLLQASVAKDSLTGTKRFQELQRIILDEQERKRKNELEAIARQNKQKQYALLTGLGIFLTIASLLYRNNKQKQKANTILEKTLLDLKATQSQLIQSEKMASLGELTAGIAHEIQNPLNFVNNFSEVNNELISEMNEAIEKLNFDEAKTIARDIADNQEKINHHGKRADAIVKGMLQHSRSSSGVKEPTDINALADEYLRLAYHGLRAKDKAFNATIKTDFDETIDNINIIPQEMGRVILNLITNAFYAVTEKRKSQPNVYKPTVSVRTKKENDMVLISVKDNGNGIPPKVLDKIFQPFFTTKPTGQGTGLGLSLSYDIVKAHGGTLRVETEEGKGSEFIIVLPGV